MATSQVRERSRNRARLINGLIAVSAVMAGGLLYVLYRPADPAFMQQLREMGFDGAIRFLRDHLSFPGFHPPQWMVFSLPDGLWAFAYTLVIITIWFNSDSILKYLWYATIPALTFGSEFLQLPGILPGTFCLNDVMLISIGLLAGVVASLLTLKKSPYEKVHALGNAG